jgi:hypothetical protein
MILGKCMGVRRTELSRAPAADDGEWKSVDMEDTDGNLGNTGDQSTRVQVAGWKSTTGPMIKPAANIFGGQRQRWWREKDGLSGKKRQQRNWKSERLDNNEQKRGKQP